MCCIVKCCNCHILLAVDMAGVACQGLVCVCVCVEVGKMATDTGMTIHKGIVVSFLPCLAVFLRFHSYMYMLFQFLKCFMLLVSVVFLWGERYEWCLYGVVV